MSKRRVIIIDILVGLAILVLVLALVGLIVSARMALPVSEWMNGLFRRVGLAGPWQGSRTVGKHGLGTIDGTFDVREVGPGGTGFGHRLPGPWGLWWCGSTYKVMRDTPLPDDEPKP